MKSKILNLLMLTFLCQITFAQWAEQAFETLDNGYSISGISAVDSNIVWAVAWDNLIGDNIPLDHITKVLKTTDGGQSWQGFDVEEAPGRISFDIHAFDENTAWITTQDFNNGMGRGLFLTTDGGETWTEKFHDPAGGVWVHFFDEMNGVCVNRQSMATTTDGGENWNLVTTFPPFQSGDFTILPSGTNSRAAVGDRMWFGTLFGRIYRTFTKGHVWGASDFPVENAMVHSVAFRDSLNGLAISSFNSDFSFASGTRIARTTDGGITWELLDTLSAHGLLNIAFVPGSENSYVGTARITHASFLSNDGGETWEMIDNMIPGGAIDFISPQTGWMARDRPNFGTQPAIYRWDGEPFPAIITATEERQLQANINILPNPFADHFSILVEAEKQGTYRVQLIDLAGKVVKATETQSGATASIDTREVSSGAYFVKIFSEEGMVTKKVIKR